MFVFVRALGFLRLNLTCPVETRTVVLYTWHCLGPGFFLVCRDCFDSLSDRCSNERCEGVGKTAMSWVCELLYSQSRVGVVDLSCSELQGIQKHSSLTLFLLPL